MLVQLSILALCHTVLAMPGKPVYDVEDLARVQMLFEDFIAQYHRTYDDDEKMERLQYFKQSLAKINVLNERNPYAVFDITKFADRSLEEIQSVLGYSVGQTDFQDSKCDTINVTETVSNAPDAFDWKDKGAVTPVKELGNCFAYGAFSATENVESAYAIKYKKQVILSQQQLIDCDKQSNACKSKSVEYALTELINQGGQESEADYPFTDKNGTSCKFDSSKIAAKVVGCRKYSTINGTDVPLKDILYNNGPLTIGLSTFDFIFYISGILSYCEVDFGLDARLLLTGYGRAYNIDFWNIKCLSGTQFGENGYARVKRGVSCQGIGTDTSIAVVG